MDIAQLGISVDSRQVKNATGDLSGIVKAANSAESATNKLTGAVAGLAAAFGGLSIAATGLQAMRDFSREMAGLQAVTRASTADMQKLADQARLLGAATQYGAGEAASAQRALAQAGLETNQILSATGNVLALAQAGQLGLAQSADLAANVMSQFNLTAQQTGMIADVLVKTGDKATTSVTELGEGFKYAGPLAASLGVSLQDTSAALGIISNSGIKASSAGTGLLGVFRQLSNVSNEAAAILQSYGVSVDQVDISTRGLIPVIELLASKNIAAGDAVKIFGSESVGAALALLKAGENVRAFSADLQNATGAAQQNADIMADNLDSAIKGVAGAFEGLVLSAKGSDGALKDAANTATGVINSFSGVNDELVKAGQMSSSAAAGYDTIANSLTMLAALLAGRVVGGFAASTAAKISDVAATRAALVANAQQTASVLALETRLKALALQELANARIRGVDTVAASTAAATATARYNMAVVAADAANKAASASAGVLRGALALLGGPIGLVTTLLTVGVTAWITWGNKGGQAIDNLNAKMREHNRLKGAMGSAEIADLREGYNAANEKLKLLLTNRDRLFSRGEHTGGIDAEINSLRKSMVFAKDQIAATTTEIKKQQAATADLTKQTTNNAAVQNTFLTEQQEKLAEVAALKRQFAEEDKKGNFDAETRASRQVALQEKIDAIMKRGASTRASAANAAAKQAAQVEDAYGDIERSLSKQLMTEEELTTAQKVAMDLTDKRYKHLSEKQKANLIALAKEVDAFKAQQQLFKDMAASAQELSESDTKRQQAAVDAAYASYQAVDQQLKKLQEEADTYGMTETEIQRYLLAKAEEKLALEQGGEARQGVIDQLNREIETRKDLVSATSGSEMRKATDSLGERVQDTLADAIKDGLAADNPIKGFAKSLGNSVKNALMDAVANGLSARIVAALGMGGASGAAAASGGGDIFSLGSDAKQIYDMFSGASVGNSASGALQAFSTSSAGQYFGLSDATGSLTQAGADLTVEVGNLADSVNTYAGYAKAAYDVYSAFKEGEGWGAAAGSVIGAYFGGGVGAAIGNKIGSMVDSAFSGGGGEKAGGNYNAAFVGGMATNENFFGGYTPSQADAQLKTAVNDFYKNYTQTVKDLGGVAKDLTLNLGFDTDPSGSAGNRLSAQVAVGAVTSGERELWQASVLSMVSESVGEIPEAINLATGKMLLAALKESELPAEYARVFNGVDIKSATQEQITAMQNALAAIRTLNTAFDNFGKTLPQLAGLTYEAKEAIATFGGGLETFSGSLNSYVDLYYSDAEKAAMATKQLQSQFSQLNITMPASTAEFRKMVEAQDLTTESGRKTYAALISLSGAFDSAADAAKAANESLLTGALSTLADSIAAEQDAINAAADAAIEGYEKQIDAQQALADAAEKSASSIAEVIGILQSGITSLRGYSFEQGRSFITSAIAQARAGAMPDKEQLAAAVDAVKAIDESGFGTREELERVKASAAADMDTLQAIAGTQLTTAQRQANAAEEQIKRLNALIESTIDSRDRQLESLDLLYQTQEKQVNALLGIQSATLSVKDAIEGLSALISSQTPPASGGGSTGGVVYTGPGSAPEGTTSPQQAVADIYQKLLGREADYGGLIAYSSWVMQGKSLSDVEASIRASDEYKSIHGSHRNGLDSVPFDGYRAELHAGERVLTAQQADSSDKMAADIAEMRREVSAAMYAIAANTLRTAKLQERWDGDGLPDPRGY